jgi:rSAM/selenodomain-associated transferase 2
MAASSKASMSVSVIIPTLNEAACLRETLSALRKLQPHEIIVVDGGSQDATCEIASQILNSKFEFPDPKTNYRDSVSDVNFSLRISNFKLFHSPPGRAHQLNLGASHATGETLVFLHADCQLEASGLEAAEKCLSVDSIVAGCFTMQVCGPGRLYRLIDSCATARVRLSGLIYGDQGLFLRRDLFHRLGGFPDIRLMEDLFFSRTLSQHGRVAVLPNRIFVSPRRWQRTGLIRQSLRNWLLTALAAGGVHPDRLAVFYPHIR